MITMLEHPPQPLLHMSHLMMVNIRIAFFTHIFFMKSLA